MFTELGNVIAAIFPPRRAVYMMHVGFLFEQDDRCHASGGRTPRT